MKPAAMLAGVWVVELIQADMQVVELVVVEVV